MYLCWWCGGKPEGMVDVDADGNVSVTFKHVCPRLIAKEELTTAERDRRDKRTDRVARMELLLREYRRDVEAPVLDVELTEKFLVKVNALIDEIDADEEAEEV